MIRAPVFSSRVVCADRINRTLAFALALTVGVAGTSLAQITHAPGADYKENQLVVSAPDGNWPCWRGPGSAGVHSIALAVIQWSESQGILWKAPVPGQGHASPIVFGDQIFVSTADERAQTQTLLAYHRQTGRLQWDTMFYRGRLPYKNEKNSHASATPACDGTHVFVPSVADNGVWLTAISLAGKVVWQKRLGPFASEWGYASSPALYRDLVIVAGDNKGAPGAAGSPATSYLVGVDRQTGATVWRAPRPLIPSYGTPVVAHVAGRDQLLTSGAERIVAYDPVDGQEIWSYRWGASRSANSMVWGPDCVYASTTWRDHQMVCVRADGTGDVTGSHMVWKHARSVTDVPSALYHDGRLYLTTDRGLAVCLDGATGKTIWQNRLGGPISASPVLAGQTILSVDEAGTAHLFKTGPQFELLASNSLNDRILASPALAGDHIFLRSSNFLYCLDGQTQRRPLTTAAQRTERPAASKAPAAPATTPAQGNVDIPWFWELTVGVPALLWLIMIAALFISERRRN